MLKRIEEIRARTAAPSVREKNLGDWIQQWLETYALDRCQPKTLERYRQLTASKLASIGYNSLNPGFKWHMGISGGATVMKTERTAG